MVEVWGKVPEYRGRGRPSTKKRPGADWRYLQMVKQRENGRVMGINAKTIYGDEREVLEKLSGGRHQLRGAHQPHLAPHERQVGQEDVGLLEGVKDAEGVLDLGRHSLQPGPGAKDLEGREPRIRWQAALDRAFTGDGGGTNGAHLGDRRAADHAATSNCQHLIGRLPG